MTSPLPARWTDARCGSRLATIVAIVVALTFAPGCKKPEEAKSEAPVASAVATPTPAPPPPAPTFAVGDQVDVKWNSSWWKATILAVNGDKYHIHYTGWGSSWDEDVTADRVRAQTADSSVGSETTAASAAPTAVATAARTAAASTSAPKAAATWKPGDKVDVNWNGQWWQGQILTANGSQYKIHYTGWASSWDEVVGPNRLRAPTAGAKRGSGS
jgi:hypothetical protein